MQESQTLTDSFGDEMVYVESYGGYLPKHQNIPTDTGYNGVSGISHDGDIYCIDCAKDMGIIEIVDGEIYAVVEYELMKSRKAPWTGVVLPTHETMTQYHCGRHEHCENSLSGDEHPYNHSSDIGIGIEEKVIGH